MKISLIVHNVHIRHVTGLKSSDSISWIFTFKSDHFEHLLRGKVSLTAPTPQRATRGWKEGFSCSKALLFLYQRRHQHSPPPFQPQSFCYLIRWASGFFVALFSPEFEEREMDRGKTVRGFGNLLEAEQLMGGTCNATPSLGQGSESLGDNKTALWHCWMSRSLMLMLWIALMPSAPPVW